MPKKKSPVRQRPRYSTFDEDKTFTLLMQRFDKVDADNLAIQTSVTTHIAEDAKVHAGLNKTLDKHKTYWGLLLKITGACLAGFIAWSIK